MTFVRLTLVTLRYAKGNGDSPGHDAAVVTGRIVDAATPPALAARALEALTVTAAGTAVSAPVDDLGRFRLPGVHPGNVTLEFAGAHVEASVTIPEVERDHEVHVALRLLPRGR